MEDQWVDLRVAQALRAEEVADPTLLHRREKLRIAGELGLDVAKVRVAVAAGAGAAGCARSDGAVTVSACGNDLHG